MAETIALKRFAEIAVRIDLDDAEIRPAFRMSANGAERPGVLAGECEGKTAGRDVGRHEGLDGVDGGGVHPVVQLERRDRGNAAPFPVRLEAYGLIVQFDLLRS